MEKFVSPAGIILTLDPKDALPNVECNQLFQQIGIIPQFFDDVDGDMWEQLENGYGFPLFTLTGGVVNEQLQYVYPEDPVLNPLAMYETTTEVMMQYDYGICAIFPKGKPSEAVVTRAD